MRVLLTIACALMGLALFAARPASAFTFENPSNGAAATGGPGSGYVDLEAKGLIPPMGQGEAIPDMKYNDGPGAYNNGFASPPDPSSSIGPRWLYGPSR